MSPHRLATMSDPQEELALCLDASHPLSKLFAFARISCQLTPNPKVFLRRSMASILINIEVLEIIHQRG